MRFAALLQAAALILAFLFVGSGMSASCSNMSKPNDAALAIGAAGTAVGWLTLLVLGWCAYHLGRRELRRFQREYEDRESKSEDEG